MFASMLLYQVNNDMTYVPSERVAKKNAYLHMEPENSPLPTYEEVKDRLPKPIWDGHEDALKCYDYAWKIAFGNLSRPNGDAGFVSNFIDTAFNGYLFMWDSSFIVMFGKYASHVFDFQKTLDNFYSHQHMDGFICREICESEPGEHFSRHDPSSTGPNIMPWSEWEYFCLTGDRKRIERIFDPLTAYHLWLKQNRTWRDGTYWSTGWGCGMDNQPRLEPQYDESQSHGFMVWLDACVQMVLSGKILIKMASVIGRDDDPSLSEIKEEVEFLTKVINDNLWDEDDAFYYDMYKDGSLNHVKSVGAYWTLLADIIPPERLEKFVAHLDNPAEFKRPNRVPTLSADHPEYRPDGGYWKGSVWAPTNYMTLKGLEKNGFNELAYDVACANLENIVQVFLNTGTIWENYAPEFADHGSSSKPEFVGWSGLFPISIMLEYVLGIRPKAEKGAIEWHVRRTERHGVEKYNFSGKEVDLICEARENEKEEPKITVKSSSHVKVEVHWNGKIKTIEV